jgi:hypothetical protein
MPRGIRAAAWLCLVLSCFTGMLSAIEATGLVHFDEYKQAHAERPNVFGSPEVSRRVQEAQFAALEPQRESRVLILGALSMTCAFAFVASARMLRPGGLSREGVRRMLGGTALATAALRTIDGAQWAVVVRRMSGVMAEAMVTLPEFKDPAAAEQVKALAPTLLFFTTALQTAVVAGAFVLLGQYFRSQRVRDAVLAVDGPLDAEE